MAPEPNNELFRRRARAEAARYGSDPWVFVRELLQNSRDAGASRVEIEVSRNGDHERVLFRDDGCGMSYEHARRYLFALYASSKEDSREQAGKFGIGFWSVLRFEPSTLVIRSCASRGKRARGAASHGNAWQVSLDGELGSLEETAADLEVGTEIVLERPASEDEDLASRVMAATRHYGRFLSRRDDPEVPLPVTVDGLSANAELKFEAPCATFRGKGFRGAVGLGKEPEVELFAQGLFVRSASSLQDLQAAGELSDEAGANTEDVLAELPSLAPRVVVDSAELDLLLARSDARYDKHLKRILRTAEKQLGRLITRQLQALKPQPFYRLWWGAFRDWLGPTLGWQLAAAGLIGLVIGLALLWALPSASWVSFASFQGDSQPSSFDAVGDAPDLIESASGAAAESEPESSWTPWARRTLSADGLPAASSDDASEARPGTSAAGVRSGPAPNRAPVRGASQALHAYSDLADRYAGPRPGGILGDLSQLLMLYEPVDATPFFAALVIDDLATNRWAASPTSGELAPYRSVPCQVGCVEAHLLVAAGQEAVRLPVPTGHRLDAASVRFGGRPEEVYETAVGEALLRLPDGLQGVVEYRTGPAPSPPARRVVAREAFDAPAELIRVAEDILRLPAADRVQHALDYVTDRVVYDRSPAAWEQSSPAYDGQSGFIEQALEAGAGDCDVQSGVLVTLLRLIGIEARLVLGYVGTLGTVAPGLHAWVEVRGADGRWTIADPSVSSGAGSGPSLLPASIDGLRYPSLESDSPVHPAVPFAAAALLLGSLAWLLRRRSAAGLELFRGGDEDESSDQSHLAALLGGALRHPQAFAGLPAMFHGRFVPLLGRQPGSGGKNISLARARRMARKNRLFRSSTGSALASRAAARGVPVIDASTAEGRVLSLALGAIDVDRWSNLLESLQTGAQHGAMSEVCRRLDRRLSELGAPFRLREAPEMSQPWVEIALDDLKLGERQVLIDPHHADYAPVRTLAQDRPRAAAFTLLDILLQGLELPENERARLLAELARGAVEEAAGNGGLGLPS